MPNPFTAVYNMALPNELSQDPNQAQQQKIIAFACILTFLAALYSIIKWYKLGYDDLADWAWLLVIGAPVLAVLNKQKLLPVMLMANISISFMTIYCCSLIYHLDGLNSAHIFWVVNVMVFAFLITNSVYGMAWFAVMTTFMVWLIYADQAGWEIPMFELDEKQAKVNLYSGYILPTIVIGFTLWYSNKIRHEAIETAQNSEREALEHTRRSSKMSDRLGTILQKTSVNADTLLKSADDLSQTMSSMLNQSASINQRIESQSESTHHMSETLNAMSDSVDRSAGIMKEIDGDVSDTHRDITQSASSMDQAIENMAHIRESHKAILSSMEIISDIADQTNLLALNAAIEAARAGDQGRGFAVVADEVRTLSIRSNESAQQIRQLLDAATQDIEQGSEMVNVAGERLDHAAQAFSSISSKISDAAGIANGQRSDIESIVSLSQSLDGSMKENEQAAHELSNNADALASVADNLNQVAHETNEVVHESDRLLK